MFEKIDKFWEDSDKRFEERLDLFEKRLNRALRLKTLSIFIPVVFLAISTNLLIYFNIF